MIHKRMNLVLAVHLTHRVMNITCYLLCQITGQRIRMSDSFQIEQTPWGKTGIERCIFRTQLVFTL